MRKWKETISEWEDIAWEIIKNEAEKDKKIGKIEKSQWCVGLYPVI